ncbi:hypothetical protein D3C80_93600 [compost metagenome]
MFDASSKLKGVKMKAIVSIKIVEKWVLINGKKEARYDVYVDDCLIDGNFVTINEARNFISGYVMSEHFNALIKSRNVEPVLESKKSMKESCDFDM